MCASCVWRASRFLICITCVGARRARTSVVIGPRQTRLEFPSTNAIPRNRMACQATSVTTVCIRAMQDSFKGVYHITRPLSVEDWLSPQIPPELRKTFTYDQGREMSKHVQLTELTGMAVYFYDQHSPWQRGLNENTNGLLRQHWPRGQTCRPTRKNSWIKLLGV